VFVADRAESGAYRPLPDYDVKSLLTNIILGKKISVERSSLLIANNILYDWPYGTYAKQLFMATIVSVAT
jgi:hypothetical protein